MSHKKKKLLLILLVSIIVISAISSLLIFSKLIGPIGLGDYVELKLGGPPGSEPRVKFDYPTDWRRPKWHLSAGDWGAWATDEIRFDLKNNDISWSKNSIQRLKERSKSLMDVSNVTQEFLIEDLRENSYEVEYITHFDVEKKHYIRKKSIVCEKYTSVSHTGERTPHSKTMELAGWSEEAYLTDRNKIDHMFESFECI